MMMSPGNHPLKIAFANMDEAQWTAGIHYLKNLFVALHSVSDRHHLGISLLMPNDTSNSWHNGFASYIDQVLYWPKPSLLQRFYNFTQQKLDIRSGPNPFRASYLRSHQIDIIFATSAEFGPAFNIPLLSWIPDFQHLHLPHLFSLEARQALSKNFTRVAKYADRVILSSQSAFKDFQSFAPNAIHKARVLSFVAQVPANIYELTPELVTKQYQLPQKFIYLPNQFWKHKNHEIVIEALTLAKAKNPEVTIVCTGNTNDHRYPLYFSELLTLISANGLRDNFIILGLVPHEHLFQLMRQSLAVLQPSLFEGWSTTIEEVKSVGKNVIVSDIPVHREQAPPEAVYFDAQDSEVLAGYLLKTFEERRPGPNYELEEMARDCLPKRTREFAETFMKIVHEITSA